MTELVKHLFTTLNDMNTNFDN